MITKTFVGSKSIEIQEALFKLGFIWAHGPTNIDNSRIEGLLIDWDKKRIYSTWSFSYFLKLTNKELPLGELFSKIEEETKEMEKSKAKQFKPFDKVLVRDSTDQNWIPAIFGYYKGDMIYPYSCVAPYSSYTYAIPYEGNEHRAYTKN